MSMFRKISSDRSEEAIGVLLDDRSRTDVVVCACNSSALEPTCRTGTAATDSVTRRPARPTVCSDPCTDHCRVDASEPKRDTKITYSLQRPNTDSFAMIGDQVICTLTYQGHLHPYTTPILVRSQIKVNAAFCDFTVRHLISRRGFETFQGEILYRNTQD